MDCAESNAWGLAEVASHSGFCCVEAAFCRPCEMASCAARANTLRFSPAVNNTGVNTSKASKHGLRRMRQMDCGMAMSPVKAAALLCSPFCVW